MSLVCIKCGQGPRRLTDDKCISCHTTHNASNPECACGRSEVVKSWSGATQSHTVVRLLCDASDDILIQLHGGTWGGRVESRRKGLQSDFMYAEVIGYAS
jgi:hypothetical protein